MDIYEYECTLWHNLACVMKIVQATLLQITECNEKDSSRTHIHSRSTRHKGPKREASWIGIFKKSLLLQVLSLASLVHAPSMSVPFGDHATFHTRSV